MYKIIFAVFFVVTEIFSQNIYLTGTVVDSSDNKPLTGANVVLSTPRDDGFYGSTSDREGKFSVMLIRGGEYSVKISFVGYETYSTVVRLRRQSQELGTVKLKPSSINLSDVEVVAKTPPAIQKEDTSEFNADAFKTREGASAEDLVSKMPGMVVENGTIKSQGEEVQRILVDGKQFFSDDPSAVLKNLPSDIVDKIQVYDQQSEQSQFTGFDDGNTLKTLNIVTRMRIRQGIFGGITGGYGNEERYKGAGNINFFDNQERISILGQTNNTNDQNFSTEDLLGIVSASERGGGGRGGRGGGMPGGGGFGGWGGPASNFLVSPKSGLTKTYAFGLNYGNEWENNVELSTSYFFNKTNNSLSSVVTRDYYSAQTLGQKYNETTLSNSNNTNHRFNMRFEWEIDSMRSINFRPRISAQLNDGSTTVNGSTYTIADLVNALGQNSNSDRIGLNGSAELLYRRRFETRGRSFSIGFNGRMNRNKGETDLYSETFSKNSAYSDTTDQFTDSDRSGFTGSTNITYTEPLSERSQIQLTTSLSYSEDENDKKNFQNYNTDGSKLDTSLSNVYNRVYTTKNFGAGYRYQDSLFNFNGNLSYRFADLENEQQFPYTTDLTRSFRSLLPSFRFSYSPSRDLNLRINYRAENNPPGVDKLQNVLDNSDPLRLSTGNPELRQDYTHSLNMRFSSINFETMNSFFFMIGGSYTNDYIANSTFYAQKDTALPELPAGIVLLKGGQFSKPVNLDGFYNIRSFFTYSLPSGLIKSNVNLNVFGSYSRTPSIISDQDNFIKSFNYGAGVVIASNFSRDVDFTISTNANFSNVKNDLQPTRNNNFFTQYSSVKLYWMFWEGFAVSTEFNHQYNEGLSEDYDKNSILWNFSLVKKLFANNAGEIRLTAFDILKNAKNIRRTVTDAYYEDSSSNVLEGYYLLSFTYNLRIFN
ncbi:MAG TPA: TonB-dependent receptor [Ignavibacteriaceae bacterium]|nr:TonB-dependent receptor [Ignavibacteriaceae bacterium]